MKKEFFKTMLLYLLVFVAIFLTASIWSGKELWSQDYSSFLHNIRKSAFSSDDYGGSYMTKTELQSDDFYSIEWISLSYNGSRSVKYLGEEDFDGAYDIVNTLKGDISRAGTISYVNNDDYVNAFKGSGIAVKFSSYISLADFLRCEQNFFDILKFPRVNTVFITVSSDSSTKYLYFYDYETKQNYRLPVDFDGNNIAELMSFEAKTAALSDSFSFELNFDKKNEDMERIQVESLVPVTLSDRSIFDISASKVLYSAADNTYDSIFKKFNIKKNSARSYTDNENTISFIESHATLKIYKNGSFTYEVGESFAGVALGNPDESAGAVLFANTLYKECVDTEAFLTLKRIKEEDGFTQYEFSYATDSASLYSEEESAAVMKVKNGNVIYYKQLLLDITKSEHEIPVGSLINAYDEIYNIGLNLKKADLKIVDLHPVNVYIKNGSVTQKWYIEFSDGSFEYL